MRQHGRGRPLYPSMATPASLFLGTTWREASASPLMLVDADAIWKHWVSTCTCDPLTSAHVCYCASVGIVPTALHLTPRMQAGHGCEGPRGGICRRTGWPPPSAVWGQVEGASMHPPFSESPQTRRYQRLPSIAILAQAISAQAVDHSDPARPAEGLFLGKPVA